MAKSKNNLSGLLNSLAQSKRTGSSGDIPSITGSQSASAGNTLTPGSLEGTRGSSIGAKTISQEIGFGRPSSTKTATATSRTDWSKLLEQTASGGLSSALEGSFGLGSIAGLGSIISSIASVFGGGKSTPAPLQEFQLPATQNQAITVGTNGSSGSNVTVQSLQDQSTQIAQAVKTALLHSSTLNDVIAEI